MLLFYRVFLRIMCRDDTQVFALKVTQYTSTELAATRELCVSISNVIID